MKKISIAISIILLSVLPAMAQPLTLEECKQLARENNFALSSAKTNVEMALQQKREAFTNFFPGISAVGGAFEANRNLIEIDLGIMELGLIKKGIVGGVQAVQPLFAGGQIFNSNKLAAKGVEASELELELSMDEVDLTTERYYWNVVSLKEKLKTIEILSGLLDSTDKDVTALVDAGIATRNDLLQVQIRTNELESKRVAAVNGLRISRMLLSQYIGSDAGDSLDVLSDIDFDALPEFPIGLKVDHESALGLTAEYRLLETNVEAKKLEKRIEVGKYMPGIGVGAGYGYNDLLDNDITRAMVFATVSVPISGWWGGSHAIKRKKLAEQEARNQLSGNSELLIIKMENAWSQVENAYSQLLLQRKSIDQAEENLRLSTDMYQAGTITMTDYLQAQSLYQLARDEYVDSYVAFQLSQTEYIQATRQER